MNGDPGLLMGNYQDIDKTMETSHSSPCMELVTWLVNGRENNFNSLLHSSFMMNLWNEIN